MAECRHRIDLCPECDGLIEIESKPLDVLDFRVHDANGDVLSRTGPTTLWVGRIDRCPNPPRKETDGG